jgi:hypothetical protein
VSSKQYSGQTRVKTDQCVCHLHRRAVGAERRLQTDVTHALVCSALSQQQRRAKAETANATASQQTTHQRQSKEKQHAQNLNEKATKKDRRRENNKLEI